MSSVSQRAGTGPDRTVKTPEIRLQGWETHWHEWIAQQYGVSLAFLGHALDLRPDLASRRVRRWVQTGRIQVGRVDYGWSGPWRRSAYFDGPDTVAQGPLWVFPPAAAASLCLGFEVNAWEPKPTTVAHLTAVSQLRLTLTGMDTDPDVWTSERLLRHQFDVGTHIHDAWMLDPDDYDKVWAIEVELTRKSGGGGRLKQTIKDALTVAQQNDLAGVKYYVRGAGLQRQVQTAANHIARQRGLDHLENFEVHDLDATLVRDWEVA